MNMIPDNLMHDALEWCTAELGEVQVVGNHSKEHGGHVSATCRLRCSEGICYLKVHQSQSHWHSEVHAYEQWTGAFCERAPRLIRASEECLVLLVTEVPGHTADSVNLSMDQEVQLWHEAGTTLAELHTIGPGPGFGGCLRGGSLAENLPGSASDYVAFRLEHQLDRAAHAGYLGDSEEAVLQMALNQTSVFEGETAVPCHRDYNTANWLVDDRGRLTGVIDFEFSRWDVPVCDFSRHPEWQWMARPHLMHAFLEGYGWPLTPGRQQQLFIARAQYALEAIVWGRENSFFGFEREGRECLAHLARQGG